MFCLFIIGFGVLVASMGGASTWKNFLARCSESVDSRVFEVAKHTNLPYQFQPCVQLLLLQLRTASLVIQLLGKCHCKINFRTVFRFCTNNLLVRTCTLHLSVHTQRIGTVQTWKLFSYLPGVQSMFVPQHGGLSSHGRRQYFFYMGNLDHISGHQQDVSGLA